MTRADPIVRYHIKESQSDPQNLKAFMFGRAEPPTFRKEHAASRGSWREAVLGNGNLKADTWKRRTWTKVAVNLRTLTP